MLVRIVVQMQRCDDHPDVQLLEDKDVLIQDQLSCSSVQVSDWEEVVATPPVSQQLLATLVPEQLTAQWLH